jgi:hypothetical protein
MTTKQLEDVMLFHLQNFNDEAVTLTTETVHDTVLSTSDGFGPSNSKNIYRGVIRWTIKKQKMKDKPWPKDWMKSTVADLASKLIIFLMLLLPFAGQSQLTVNLGAGKTDLRDNAVTIGITYLKSFDSIWRNNDYLFAGKNSLFALTPEMNLQTGTQDAFSSLNIKMTGLFMTFKTTEVSGIATPNTAKAFNTFPVSIGAETNNLFNNINGIVEAGWVPWYQNATTSPLLKNTKFGVFLQTGYKFHIDSNTAKGGGIDGSEELPNRAILRTKGSLAVDTKSLININGLKAGLVGSADVWYDFVNSAVYHRIEGRGRFYLDAVKYIDLIYQKGSGAPNFNQGDQYGVGLTITF